MPKNEEGEFELVLGNRQLLSVFFITIILLGVFFAAGYRIGLSSAPVTPLNTSAAVPAAPKPLVVDSPSEQPREPEPVPPAPQQPVVTATQQPAETAAKTETPVHEREPATKPEAGKSSKAKERARAPSAPPAPEGVYLQLSATRKPEAEAYVDVLTKKGFSAMSAPVPENPALYRVLVGPFTDGELNKARTELQGAGFPGDKAMRKKF